MKRFCLVSGMLLITALSVGILALTGLSRGKTVYLKEGGTGNGSSPDSPLGSITEAYRTLGEEGGRIVVCGDFCQTADFVAPAHTGTVTVTQLDQGVDYRDRGSYYVKKGARFLLNGPTVFENITVEGRQNNSYLLIVAQFNPITMGEGVTCSGFRNSLISDSVTILGGCQGGAGTADSVTEDLDTHIMIRSGTFIVVGFNRHVGRTFTGRAHIEIAGGTIPYLYTGSVNAGCGGGTALKIGGGTFSGNILCNASPSAVSGDVEITITDGDFSACRTISGAAGQGTSRIDLSEFDGRDALLRASDGL